MQNILAEFHHRVSFLGALHHREAHTRLGGFYDWLTTKPETSEIVDDIANQANAQSILCVADFNNPPIASTPEEITAVGLELMRLCKTGKKIGGLASDYGILPSKNQGRTSQDVVDEVFRRYIKPAIDYIERTLSVKEQEGVIGSVEAQLVSQSVYPQEISISLKRFLKDHPVPRRSVFIMMGFGVTPAHNSITSSIKNALAKYDMAGLRADDKEYHEDLFPNVLTYMYGCDYGIAVFERLQDEIFNPNVALEFGYMRALKKPICLLKDRTCKTLQTDLVGKLYKSFDPQNPEETIPQEIEIWLRDKDIITL